MPYTDSPHGDYQEAWLDKHVRQQSLSLDQEGRRMTDWIQHKQNLCEAISLLATSTDMTDEEIAEEVLGKDNQHYTDPPMTFDEVCDYARRVRGDA